MLQKSTRFNWHIVFSSFSLLAAACVGNAPATLESALTAGSAQSQGSASPQASVSGDGNIGPILFEAVAPRTYLNKLKTLVNGEALNANELAAVVADPNAVSGLVAGWLRSPTAKTKMLNFFGNAFQQSHLDGDGHYDFGGLCGHFGDYRCGSAWGQVASNFSDSFGHTMWELAMVQGLPFTNALTTRSFMMTTAQLSNLYYKDNGADRYFETNYPAEMKFYVTSGPSSPAIPISETLDANSANFRHWHVREQMQCNLGYTRDVGASNIWQLLNGVITILYDSADANSGPYDCLPYQLAYPTTQFAAQDFNDWRLVTTRPLATNERMPRFWDLTTLRQATTAGMRTPRVGFFSTIAFMTNWQTNNNNQYRANLNQTLIVALGLSLASATPVQSAGTSGDLSKSDAAHASDPACAVCHVTLDPMRRFFTQSYATQDWQQTDATLLSLPGTFTLDGITSKNPSVDGFADALASDPRFAPAWVQRVCYWANSAACNTNDPEFVRITAAFTASNFNFRQMLIDVLSSPMVTGATFTQTASQTGEQVTLSRSDHFCTTLATRLDLDNPCSLTAVGQSIPSDNFSRGNPIPFQPTQPDLFYRSGIENVCRAISQVAVDGVGSYSSASPIAAIADMVQNLMGVPPNDERYHELLNVVQSTYNSAITAKATPADALRSTFTMVCTSPLVAGVGL